MRSSTLTVYFEGPFWVAILERTEGSSYQVARVVLGSEPTDAELFRFLADNHDRFRFDNPVEVFTPPRENHRGGKAAARVARKEAGQVLDA